MLRGRALAVADLHLTRGVLVALVVQRHRAVVLAVVDDRVHTVPDALLLEVQDLERGVLRHGLGEPRRRAAVLSICSIRGLAESRPQPSQPWFYWAASHAAFSITYSAFLSSAFFTYLARPDSSVFFHISPSSLEMSVILASLFFRVTLARLSSAKKR